MFTDQQFMSWTGQAVLYLLILILSMRPIIWSLKWTGWKKLPKLLKYRRHLGWVAGSLALSHFVYWAFVYTDSLLHSLKALSTWYGITGLLTLLIISLLAITSNDYAVRKLKQKWKKIHKLAYVLPILTIAHATLALKGFPIADFIGVSIISILLVMWRHEDLRVFSQAMIVIVLLVFVVDWFREPALPAPIPPVVDKTVKQTYYDKWWQAYWERGEFLGVPDVAYTKDQIEFCEGSTPISIGDTPLYCADGRRR